ncbi:MAG: hypothetical protein ABFD29_00145 [Anaerolineaceae bacterium]|jgi:uncharacterized protein YoxC
MFSIGTEQFLMTIAVVLLAIGAICTLIGIFVLVSRVLGKDIKTIADNTTKLVQKGITEEVSGLVGNASVLIDALNQLVTTTTGIGVFLMLIGLVLIASSLILGLQLQ